MIVVISSILVINPGFTIPYKDKKVKLNNIIKSKNNILNLLLIKM